MPGAAAGPDEFLPPRVPDRRSRVVVGLSGAVHSDGILRRAADLTERLIDGELLAVHVVDAGARDGRPPIEMEALRQAVEVRGGSFHSVLGSDPPTALTDFARLVGAHTVVVGVPGGRRSARRSPMSGQLLRQAGQLDIVEVVAGSPPVERRRRGVGHRRRLLGWLVAVGLLVALTGALVAAGRHISLAGDVSLYLLLVVVSALVGGFAPAAGCAVLASLALNWFFTLPLHTLSVTEPGNVVALAAFLCVALLVSRVVDLSARRSGLAARAGAEAETMSALAGTVLRGGDAVAALLERVRETFGMRSASLLERTDTGWRAVAQAGPGAPTSPSQADEVVDVADGRALAVAGPALAEENRRVFGAFAAQVAVAYRERMLAEAAASVTLLEQMERARTALLNAVSHDLRTPIAAAKAAVSSLLAVDIAWSDADRTELLTAADGALNRLTVLVTNLLDLSRLQAGVMPVMSDPVGLDDVVFRALDTALPTGGQQGTVAVDVDVPAELPEVRADAGLLERVVANLVQNALRYGGPGGSVEIRGRAAGPDRVELWVVDHGPGLPLGQEEAVFAPFQRLGDVPVDGTGVGLGLAIVRGFTEVMGGTVRIAQTPGGGASLVLSLPSATPGAAE